MDFVNNGDLFRVLDLTVYFLLQLMSLRGTKRCRETADDQENSMRSIHPPPLISDSVKG